MVRFTGCPQAAFAVTTVVAYVDLNDMGFQSITNYVDRCHVLQQGGDFTCRP